MLKQILLRNFQSHRKSKIELAPGINVIIGSSDSGKTAIIRALHWLIWNRPSGDAIRSTWGGDTCVSVGINGHKIERAKEGKTNLYRLDDSEFEAIRTDVPAEVSAALNIDEINMQAQFDRPFLLDASPGEVAQHFNAVVHLDMIDAGLRNVQQWIRRIEQEIAGDERSLADYQSMLPRYVQLDEIDNALKAVEGQAQTKVKLEADINRINHLIGEIAIADKQINTLERILRLENQAVTVETLVDRHKTLVAASEAIRHILISIFENDRLSGRLNAILHQEKPVEQLQKLLNERKNKETAFASLKSILNQIATLTRQQDQAEKILSMLQRRFSDEFPAICPLCGKQK